jgi:hypothetical protein
MNSPLPDLPARRFLSPWGNEPQEFTILIPLELNREAVAWMEAKPASLPGIYLASIGDNWEIYLNGKLIISEIHLNDKGQILQHSAWRDVYFPVDRSFFIPGTNILTLRIIGDPTYGKTGLSHSSPYYMDDYRVIKNRMYNFFAFNSKRRFFPLQHIYFANKYGFCTCNAAQRNVQKTSLFGKRTCSESNCDNVKPNTTAFSV